MGSITQEKDLEMLKKESDGNYTKYNPKTKANNVSATVSGIAGNDVGTILTNLFQYANNGKTTVANAVTAKGVSASPTDTFSVLANKIGQINTGKKYASGSGVTSTYAKQMSEIDNMSALGTVEVRWASYAPINKANLGFNPSIIKVKISKYNIVVFDKSIQNIPQGGITNFCCYNIYPSYSPFIWAWIPNHTEITSNIETPTSYTIPIKAISGTVIDTYGINFTWEAYE